MTMLGWASIPRAIGRFSRNVKTLLLKDLDYALGNPIQIALSRDPWLAERKNAFRGRRCFLLGCGPSLNRVDLARLNDEQTMGANGTCLIPNLRLKYFISVSHIWWRHYAEEVKAYTCERRFLPPYLKGAESSTATSWLRVVEEKDYQPLGHPVPWMFSTSADQFVVLGGTVVFVGLQILYHLGFSEVVLLGVDHNYGVAREQLAKGGEMVSAKKIDAHFMPNYYRRGGKFFMDLESMERAYRLADEAFKADGRRILNASPGTQLDVYPVVEYDRLFG